MPRHGPDLRHGCSALALCILVLLSSCAATPAFGPGSPRNGAGQPVDRTYGTPLPGDAPVDGG
jgi:hypothetical protein